MNTSAMLTSAISRLVRITGSASRQTGRSSWGLRRDESTVFQTTRLGGWDEGGFHTLFPESDRILPGVGWFQALAPWVDPDILVVLHSLVSAEVFHGG